MTNLISPDHWNGWSLNPDIPALIYIGNRHPGYRIDFDRMLSSDDLVFWFIQIGRKGWPGALEGFTDVVDEILDPHQRMSTLRQTNAHLVRDERSYTPDEIRERIAAYLADRAETEERERRYAIASANFN